MELSNTYLAAAGKGNAFTLPSGKDGVMKGMTALSGAMRSVNKAVGNLAAASLQVMLSHSLDQSAISKLLEILYRDGGSGKNSKYVMYSKFLRKTGITVQLVQDSEDAVDADEVSFKIDHSEFKKRTKDAKKLTTIYEDMWDVSEGEGLLKLYAGKVKKINPKAASTKSEDEQAGEAEQVDPFDRVMVDSGCKAAFADMCKTDPAGAANVARAMEWFLDKAKGMEDTSQLFNLVKQNKALNKALGGANASGLVAA